MMGGGEGEGGGPGGGTTSTGLVSSRATLVKSWYGYGALTEEEEARSHRNLLTYKERLKWRSSSALGSLLGRWSRSRSDVMGAALLGGGGTTPRHQADEDVHQPTIRKCHTVLALSGPPSQAASAPEQPIRPVNRLRNQPHQGLVCSRCSSLLSMASSSRYSISTEGNYVQVGTGGGKQQQHHQELEFQEQREQEPLASCSTSMSGSSGALVTPSILCKLCLSQVPTSQTWSLNQCGCTYCIQCMRAYVEFEIGEGAYEISCPDALCQSQGVVTLLEIENLVNSDLMDKHKRFRHNREVDRDVRLAWCPSAGCETVCNVCEGRVKCPTCEGEFCSVCRGPWHEGGAPCPQAAAGPPVPGIAFDSELIKCCPMCAVPIEKDEGCAQMMCKQCKHVFCWYCLASLDDDFLLRHYDKGPCKNKLGHSRASVIWHRTQVIGIFAGFGILLLVASPLLLLAAPCIVCCKCRVCSDTPKLDADDELPEESAS